MRHSKLTHFNCMDTCDKFSLSNEKGLQILYLQILLLNRKFDALQKLYALNVYPLYCSTHVSNMYQLSRVF